MQRFGCFILMCFVFVAAAFNASAGTYLLTDGSTISGQPEEGQAHDDGMLIDLSDGSHTRVAWNRFTQAALNQLLQDDKSAHDQAVIRPLIESSPTVTAQLRQFTVTPIAPPPRPVHGSGIFGLFSSGPGLFLLLILYGANIYAAYEIALFRNQPVGTVCGLAAIPLFGIASPIVCISMPSKPVVESDQKAPASAPDAVPAGAAAGAPGETAEQPAEFAPEAYTASAPEPEAPKLPDPIVFSKGDYSFNRRFFETKFANFFRLVPVEADKDMVLLVKSARGDIIARRIVRVTGSELYLQIFKENASAEEMIPFVEVSEVQIRHKDLV